MGNCLRRESSSMVWADDDYWEPHVAPKRPPIVEKQSLLGDDHNGANFLSSSSSSSSSKEVKIKVTKKQLEELLGRVDKHEDMSADQVLYRLIINGSDDFEIHHDQRSWRPRLQSIPEMD